MTVPIAAAGAGIGVCCFSCFYILLLHWTARRSRARARAAHAAAMVEMRNFSDDESDNVSTDSGTDDTDASDYHDTGY